MEMFQVQGPYSQNNESILLELNFLLQLSMFLLLEIFVKAFA